MNNIIEFFSELSMASIGARLILATLLGSFVGMERANKRYAAGIRTFALVCLGSALATVMSLLFGQMSADGVDISRIPSQILCGIGFLGAGTIIVTDRKQVKGLTTAAGLWVTATMGMAIGGGMIGPALVCFCLIIITTYYMQYMARYVENHTRTIELYIEVDRKNVDELLDFFKAKGYTLMSIERRKEAPIVENDIVLRLEIDMLHKYDHIVIRDEVMDIPGVHYVEEMG